MKLAAYSEIRYAKFTYKGYIIQGIAFRGPIFVQSGVIHIFNHIMGEKCAKGKSGAMGGF